MQGSRWANPEEKDAKRKIKKFYEKPKTPKKWAEDLSEKLKDSELVLYDGTLWKNDEMASSKVGEKTGQRMGHMNNSGPDGSIEAFKDLNVKKKIFIHINTTNPILLSDSNERKIVEENNWEVSYDGMEITI